MKSGITLILEERVQQLNKHKRSVEDDIKYNCNGELREGAIALICNNGDGDLSKFPLKWNDIMCRHLINKPYKERLIITGALIAAEIDRIQHLETS